MSDSKATKTTKPAQSVSKPATKKTVAEKAVSEKPAQANRTTSKPSQATAKETASSTSTQPDYLIRNQQRLNVRKVSRDNIYKTNSALEDEYEAKRAAATKQKVYKVGGGDIGSVYKRDVDNSSFDKFQKQRNTVVTIEAYSHAEEKKKKSAAAAPPPSSAGFTSTFAAIQVALGLRDEEQKNPQKVKTPQEVDVNKTSQMRQMAGTNAVLLAQQMEAGFSFKHDPNKITVVETSQVEEMQGTAALKIAEEMKRKEYEERMANNKKKYGENYDTTLIQKVEDTVKKDAVLKFSSASIGNIDFNDYTDYRWVKKVYIDDELIQLPHDSKFLGVSYGPSGNFCIVTFINDTRVLFFYNPKTKRHTTVRKDSSTVILPDHVDTQIKMKEYLEYYYRVDNVIIPRNHKFGLSSVDVQKTEVYVSNVTLHPITVSYEMEPAFFRFPKPCTMPIEVSSKTTIVSIEKVGNNYRVDYKIAQSALVRGYDYVSADSGYFMVNNKGVKVKS